MTTPSSGFSSSASTAASTTGFSSFVASVPVDFEGLANITKMTELEAKNVKLMAEIETLKKQLTKAQEIKHVSSEISVDS